MDHELIDGAKKYDAATAELIGLIHARKAADIPLGEWMAELHKTTDDSLSDSDRKLARNKIDEADKKWNDLNTQIVAAEEVVKKYEPMKKEYDEQKAREEEIKDTIQNVAITVLILSVFISFFWFINYQHKRYKRLLKEGKITQEEYDRIIQSCKSNTSDDRRTNPATGLTMLSGCDSAGNAYGCSSSNSSTFDVHQDYVDRHRWD